jgi:tRNA A-37 threonylcarbamoyl transferase component Bud32
MQKGESVDIHNVRELKGKCVAYGKTGFLPFSNGQKIRLLSEDGKHGNKNYSIKLEAPLRASIMKTSKSPNLVLTQRPFSTQKENKKSKGPALGNNSLTKGNANRSVKKNSFLFSRIDHVNSKVLKLRDQQNKYDPIQYDMTGSVSQSSLNVHNFSDRFENEEKFSLNKVIDKYKQNALNPKPMGIVPASLSPSAKIIKKVQVKSLDTSQNSSDDDAINSLKNNEVIHMANKPLLSDMLNKGAMIKKIHPLMMSTKLQSKNENAGKTSLSILASSQAMPPYKISLYSTDEFSVNTPSTLSLYTLSFKRQEELNKIIFELKDAFANWPLSKSSEKFQTKISYYRIGKLLGKGAFGKVNLGMHKLTGKLVAIKSLSKKLMANSQSTKKIMKELDILKQLRHPNVLRLYETFETENHILFVTELCAGGDLLNYVRKRRKLKEDVAKTAMKQILDGLYHIHSKSILHRDIKLDNILLNTEGEIKVCSLYQICDFGVSKVMAKGRKINEQCGTPAYIAPEILKGAGYEGFAADVWSAGGIL